MNQTIKDAIGALQIMALANGDEFLEDLADRAFVEHEKLETSNTNLLNALKRAKSMLGPHSLNRDAKGYLMIESAITKEGG